MLWLGTPCRTGGANHSDPRGLRAAEPGNWNTSAETETSAVSGNRRTAVTEFEAPLGTGIITHAWCVAAGDPAGPHRIRVYHGDTLLHDFRFTLMTETH